MSDKPGNNTDARLDDESLVSRAYGKLEKPQPPAHLDRHILAAARRATAAEDHTVVQVHRWRKWTMPVALAATVVFAVPLVVRVFENTSPDFDRALAPVTMTETVATEAAPAGVPAEKSVIPAAGDISPQAMFDESAARSMPEDARRESAPAESRPAQFQVVRPPSAPGDTGVSTPESLPAVAPLRPERPEITPATPLARSDAANVASSMPAPVSRDMDVAETDMAASAEREQAFVNAAREESATSGHKREEMHSQATPTTESYRQPDTDPAGAAGGFAVTAAAPVQPDEAGIDQVIVTGSRIIEPQAWLVEIARLHERGRTQTARRELGEFLTTYPDYELPDFYPLQAGDAIYPANRPTQIVPQAESWLRGIGLMADRGDLDQARMQLAEFFARYPDYPLPEDFPLRREDARPIER